MKDTFVSFEFNLSSILFFNVTMPQSIKVTTWQVMPYLDTTWYACHTQPTVELLDPISI